MKSRGWSFTSWALAGSSALVVILLGLILFLESRVADHRTLYENARKDYAQLKRMRITYRELEARMLKMPVDAGGTNQSWPEFLHQKAKEVGLAMNITPEMSSRGPLKEVAFTVSMDAGSSGTVPRRQFVRFMDLVETQRPGFKSKAINLKFSSNAPDDFQRAQATFSHFER